MKKKIAYLVTSVQFGGSEKVSLSFLLSIDRQLFEIQPICFFRPWETDNFLTKEIRKAGFSVYGIPVSLGKFDYLWFFRRVRMLYALLRRGDFDLLHTHGYAADIVGIPTANILKIPTISTCHGFVDDGWKLSLYNCLDRIVLRFSDRIIAVSADIERDLTRRGIRSSRIKLIPNATRTDIDYVSFFRHRKDTRQCFGLSGADFVLGYVGRLSHEKGLLHLIEAVSLARKAGCPAKLIIIGEGSQKDELRDVAKKEGLEGLVVFAGFQSDVGRFYPAMDALVLPSLTEGTPMALLEAMAYGIPTIASAVGQIPEIIDPGETGILVRPEDPEQLCEKIHFLYNKPSIRNNIAKAAQDKVRSKFDVKQWTKRIETEYIKTISAAK